MRMLSNAPTVNGTVNGPLMNTPRPDFGPAPLLAEFVAMHRELDAYRSGTAVKVDGHTLSIAAVTAAARYRSRVELDGSPQNKERIIKSRAVVANKIESGTSVYGLSTGFGGSGEYFPITVSFLSRSLLYSQADTRTDQPLLLGHALLQHQHIGILPSSTQPPEILPLQDPMNTSMPEAWVRQVELTQPSLFMLTCPISGAMLIRMNSLIRGHSGVRWALPS